MATQQQNNAGPGKGLERGEFRDSLRTYQVRVSNSEAPDSFQVYTGPREDIVLIVSGLNEGDLRATWGPGWRGAEEDWRIWVEECAFALVIAGKPLGVRAGERPRPGRPSPIGQHMIERNPASVRFCDG